MRQEQKNHIYVLTTRIFARISGSGRTLAGAVVGMLLVGGMVQAAGPAPAAVIRAPAGEPLLEYTLFHELLAENDPQPLLRVYDDGRVQVHRPVYMQNAGDYSYALQPGELAGLLKMLVDRGAVRYQASALAAERRALRSGQQYQHISDTTWTHIRIRLERLQLAPNTTALTGVRVDIHEPNLDVHARRAAPGSRLDGLAAASQHLQRMMAAPAAP